MDRKARNALTVLYATFLMFSVIQTFPISMANPGIALTLSKTKGNVGERILVSGTDAPPGNLTRIYWDVVLSKKKLNETYAKGDGTFSCYVTIPEDIVGSHWIIADGASAEFLIEPNIIPKPEAGLPNDIITVNGTGFSAQKGISIKLGNKTVAGEWDWSTKLSTTPSTVTTNINGSFTCSFRAPKVDYGDYAVNATDGVANSAEADLRIGATITLDPKNGTSGTSVTTAGRGFTTIAGKTIRVTINGATAQVVADVKTRSDGTFTGQFVVPTLDEGEYVVKAMDESGISGSAPFRVTKTTLINLNPRFGAPGVEITIEGAHFTMIADSEVTLEFGILTLKNLYTDSKGEFKGTFIVPSLPNGVYNVTATDKNGLNATAPFIIAVTGLALAPPRGPTGTLLNVIGHGFTPGSKADITLDTMLLFEDINVTELGTGITFRVPTIPAGVYTVTAIDEEGLAASARFEVTATTSLTLTLEESTYSIEISLEAEYFTKEAGTNLTFTIRNSTWEMPLTVDPISPWTAPQTDEIGSFQGTFVIPFQDPKGKWIFPGGYVVQAKDSNELAAEAPLSIILPPVHIRTRSSEYMQGDSVSFYVKNVFACSFTIEIMGPLGFIKALTISEADWQTIEDWKIVPYEKVSFTLPSDAELGVWNWSTRLVLVEVRGFFTVVRPTIEKLNEEIILLRERVSNLEGDLSSLSEKLDEISSKVDTLSEEAVASLRDEIGNIQRELNALRNHISEAEEAARNAQQAASNLTTTTYIVLAISIAAAVAAILAFVAIVELGRMVVGRLRL